MDSLEARAVSLADQLNAAHRDSISAYRRFRWCIGQLDFPDRRIAVSELSAEARQILSIAAEEEGDKWLWSLLMEDVDAS
jgi:hypothetical protein